MKAFAPTPDGVWVKNGSRGPAGRQGPSESVSLCGDRATAFIEGICCEKIRGCSYRATTRTQSFHYAYSYSITSSAISSTRSGMIAFNIVRRTEDNAGP
jgi:hypothetical protein